MQQENKSSWIEFISKGNLTIPTAQLMECVKIIEIDFFKLHANHISNEQRIMKQLLDIVLPKVSFLNIPLEVIQCLIRTRSFIRLNNLNSTLLFSKKPVKNKKLQKFTS